MKKIFNVILSAITFAVSMLPIWIVFYIPHHFKITDLTEVWWGTPYFFTAIFFVLESWATGTAIILKIWDID